MKHDKDMKGRKDYKDGGSVPETQHPQKFQRGGEIAEQKEDRGWFGRKKKQKDSGWLERKAREEKEQAEQEVAEQKVQDSLKVAQEKAKQTREERIRMLGERAKTELAEVQTRQYLSEYAKKRTESDVLRMAEIEKEKQKKIEREKEYGEWEKRGGKYEKWVEEEKKEKQREEIIKSLGPEAIERERLTKEKALKQFEEREKPKYQKGGKAPKATVQFDGRDPVTAEVRPGVEKKDVEIIQRGGTVPDVSAAAIPPLDLTRETKTSYMPEYPMGGKMPAGAVGRGGTASDVNTPGELQHD